MGFLDILRSKFAKAPKREEAGTLLLKSPVASKDIPTGVDVQIVASGTGGRRVSSSVAPTPSVTSAPPKLEPPTLEEFTQQIRGKARTIQSQLQPILEIAGLTSPQALAVSRREELKVEAKRRGKGFTRLEGQRFIGGAGGVISLRRARGRGATSEVISDMVGDIKT